MPLIGRISEADIVIPSPRASARHAWIEAADGGRFRLVDLNSANGTFVNGRRITEAYVVPSDRLEIAGVPFDWNAHRPTLDRERQRPRGVTIGREPGNDVVIADPRLSAHHAEVLQEGPQLRVIDRGSANGVFVNGRQINSAVVAPGDQVMFGSMPVDLFSLVSGRRMPAPPVPAPPVPAPSVVALQPAPREERPREERASPQRDRPRSSGAMWLAITALAVILVGAGLAVVFMTKQQIVAKCEICSSELSSESAFFWQAADAQQRAASKRWCALHASEPVDYAVRTKCSYCGKVYQEEIRFAARSEQRHDEEVSAGFCSDSCKLAGAAGDLLDKGSGIVGGIRDLLP